MTLIMSVRNKLQIHWNMYQNHQEGMFLHPNCEAHGAPCLIAGQWLLKDDGHSDVGPGWGSREQVSADEKHK